MVVYDDGEPIKRKAGKKADKKPQHEPILRVNGIPVKPQAWGEKVAANIAKPLPSKSREPKTPPQFEQENYNVFELSTKEKLAYLQDCFPNCSAAEILSILKRTAGQLEMAYNAIVASQVTKAAQRPECQQMMAQSVAFLQNYKPTPAEKVAPNVNKPPPGARMPLQPSRVVNPVDTAVKPTGKKKCLIIGINYYGTTKELNGCVQDAERIKKLVNEVYGFLDHPLMMRVLTDAPESTMKPTKENIINAMSWLVSGAVPGDSLFFSFSGHGSQKMDMSGTEADGFDETILPIDFKQKGPISDDEIFNLLVRPLPSGCKLTGLMDCCHSGSGFDLEFIWDHERCLWKRELFPKHAQGDVLLISGCRDDQTSADVLIPLWGAGGALTLALIQTLSADPSGLTIKSLMDKIRAYLKQKGFWQIPQLSSTQKVSASWKFDLTHAVMNMNPMVGDEPVPREFKRQKPRMPIAANLFVR